MAQWLRPLAALPEALNSVLSTDVKVPHNLLKLQSEELDAVSRIQSHRLTYMHT